MPGKFPWTEEPRGLQSMALPKIRYDCVTAHAHTHTHTHTHTQNKEGPQPNMTGDLIRGILETEAHTGGMPGEMKAETYTPRNTNDC